MTAPSPDVIVYLTEWQIRAMFRNQGIDAAHARGECTESVIPESSRHIREDRDPIPGKIPIVRCTMVELVRYLRPDHGQPLWAVVHQYRLPTGGYAASGRPDPKSIWIGNVMYTSNPQKQPKRPRSRRTNG